MRKATYSPQSLCRILTNFLENLKKDCKNNITMRLVCLKFLVACYSEASELFVGEPLSAIVNNTELDYDKLHRLLKYVPPYRDYPNSITFSIDTKKIMKELASYKWLEIPLETIGTAYELAMDSNQKDYQNTYYTTYNMVLRTLDELFIRQLNEQLNEALDAESYSDLLALKKKISSIKILDASCGSGNYLVAAFNELYRIDSIISEAIGTTITVSPEQLYGIEIDAEAAELARISLWLANRINEVKFAKQVESHIPHLDINTDYNIVCADALDIDWNDVVPAEQLTYIVGNPPFAVSSNPKKTEMFLVKKVDMSACWVKKAAQMMLQNSSIEASFLVNNSICQGEQTCVVWKPLLELYGIIINFAHRSFFWEFYSEKRVQVSVVIVGFSRTARPVKKLFYYREDNSTQLDRVDNVKHINAYLLDAPDLYPTLDFPYDTNRPKPYNNPVNKQPKLTTSENEKFKLNTSLYITANNILTGKKEYVENLMISKPTDIIVIPRHSSIRREYLPLEYYREANIISNESVVTVLDADLVLFGLLSSALHKVWASSFGGRLTCLTLRYSAALYVTFPIPSLSDQQRKRITELAEQILSCRMELKDSLSNLYSSDMPAKLKKAHLELDNYIEQIYSPNKVLLTDKERLLLLCDMYMNKTKDMPLQLRHYRLEKDLTKKQVAEAIGISEQYYHVAEIKNRLNDTHLTSLAKFYKKDFDEMRRGIKRN